MTTTNRTHKLSRRGISPVIATVILVAVTLVAGVSIGGFVFGLFGTQTNTAQVTGASSTFPSGALGGTGTAITCETGLGYGAFSLRNVGTANAVVTEMTLTYGGQSYTMTNATTTFATGCGLITAG
ncbi:MAG: type IV pilin N-terminal domain-containing protein, partial [Thaumarchaeota archaeon]|nr:type IV pilin N-terminal domain-containing protein [Nitrososphaerota archaeon]